jgi:ribonuclease P protein component
MPVVPKAVRGLASASKDLTAARFGFPRLHRLSKPADYQHVFEYAQKSSDAYLTVLARANAQGVSRLGLAISKKNIRKAVDRNRIKRLVRESFRLKQAEIGGVDFVVMARVAAKQADSKTLRTSLDKHWIILVKRCGSC